jgi:putative ABC transport system ATP-binding protein
VTAPGGPANGPVLLSVRGAARAYRMGEVEVLALREADLEVYQGEVLVVLGPSGSGKSTLLNLIGGMDRPTSGQVLYRPDSAQQQDLSQAPDGELTLYRRHSVGFVFQFYNLIPTLTAAENVQVAAELSSRPLDTLDTLERVGLRERADHFPSQLSGGEQQRVAIARALVGDPELLLCDEPTGALDSETSEQVMALIRTLNQELGKTVVVITHDPTVTRYASRIATIRDGRIESVREAQPVPDPAPAPQPQPDDEPAPPESA